MNDNFNELDDLYLEPEEDIYYYDDEDHFDNDYDYYEYSENNNEDQEEQLEEEQEYDEYDEYEEYEEEKQSRKDFRSLLFKILVILLILFLIIWVGIKTSHSNKTKTKDNNDVVVVKNDLKEAESLLEKMKEASLKYFDEEQLSKEDKQEITLKDMIKKNYISNVSKNYNRVKTKTTIEKQEEGYQMIIEIFTTKTVKTKTYILDHYGYCINTYLCEKDQTIDNESTSVEEIEIVEQPSKTPVITEKKKSSIKPWSKWSLDEVTSCDTNAVVCNNNDSNCRKEIRVTKKTEKVGSYTKNYQTTRNAFQNATTESVRVCSLYDYVKVDNQYYRVNKNSQFKMIGAIKKELQSSYGEWQYQGRKSYINAPSDTYHTRYVFVGMDDSNCSNTCSNHPNYYYDQYEYNSLLIKVTNPASDCNNTVVRKIPAFVITSQVITTPREENIYNTVCYQSIRTR